MGRSMYKKTQRGFTIIELMISTVVFSLVLMMCLTGIVQISRAYYKANTLARSQEAARFVMDEISQSIQLSGTAVVSAPSVELGPLVPGTTSTDDATGVFCSGNKKYTYAIDRKVTNSPSIDINDKEIKNALISENVQCTDTLIPGDLTVDVSGDDRSLLAENMRLTKFSVTKYIPDSTIDLKEGGEMWQIDIMIAYGDNDLIKYTDDQGDARAICKPGTGAEFCSIVEMSKIVSRRVG